MSSTLGTHEMAGAEVSVDNIEASRVSGTSVYDTQGEKLGSIDDVVLGKRDGRVKYAILSFGGFLGIGEEHYPLPWEALKYDERQGGYVVGIPIEQLKGAPSYARSSTVGLGRSGLWARHRRLLRRAARHLNGALRIERRRAAPSEPPFFMSGRSGSIRPRRDRRPRRPWSRRRGRSAGRCRP